MEKFEKQIIKRNLYTKHDAGAMFLSAVAVPQIAGTIFVAFLMCISLFLKLDYTEVSSNNVVLVILTALSQISFIVTFFVFNSIGKFNIKRASKLNFNFNLISLIIAVLIGFIALFGFNNIILCFDALLQKLGHHTASMPLPLDNVGWFLINVVLLCILPAICEELIFRGVILNGLRQYGKWTAIIGSALLFALIHGNIDQLLYPFLLGIVLGLIVDTTNSTIPSIFVHYFNNLIVVALNFLSPDNTPVTIDFNFVVLSVIYFFIAIILIFGLFSILKAVKNKKTNSKNSNITIEEFEYYINSNNKKNKHLWIGVAVGILIWLLSLFG